MLAAAKKNSEKGKNVRSLSSYSGSRDATKEDNSNIESGKSNADENFLSAESEELEKTVMCEVNERKKMDKKTFESLKKAIRRSGKVNKDENEASR